MVHADLGERVGLDERVAQVASAFCVDSGSPAHQHPREQDRIVWVSSFSRKRVGVERQMTRRRHHALHNSNRMKYGDAMSAHSILQYFGETPLGSDAADVQGAIPIARWYKNLGHSPIPSTKPYAKSWPAWHVGILYVHDCKVVTGSRTKRYAWDFDKLVHGVFAV